MENIMKYNKKYPCPCCGYLTLTDKLGTFGICPVCYWEDDNLQYDNPDYDGGANGISLNEARKNYKNIGAISGEYLELVRQPYESEKNNC
jgi:hypothetical protein